MEKERTADWMRKEILEQEELGQTLQEGVKCSPP